MHGQRNPMTFNRPPEITDLPTEYEQLKSALSHLTARGVVGFFTHFEATEIFAFHDEERKPNNVFSIIVAEERQNQIALPPRFLGDRIRLKSLHGWMFGIRQCIRPIAELLQAIERLDGTNEWRVSDAQLHVGSLFPLPPQFVSADSTECSALNNVLKNNFWSGSHVVELMDTRKTSLRPLLDEPPRLRELSEAIQKQVPIRIGSLSDRLGNILIQVPVTALIATFGKNRITGESPVNICWHPQASPRPLRASSETTFDKILTSYASAEFEGSTTTLPTRYGEGLQRGILWDDHHQLVMAATAWTGHIESVGVTTLLGDPEPRIFYLQSDDNSDKEIRVGVSDAMDSVVNAPAPDRGASWLRTRVYREEAARLAAQRRFVQYKPVPGQQYKIHEKALQDIRLLLTRYGRSGAWIWDPYLSADDVLRTLFYCPHKGAELRALTAGHERPSGSRSKPTLSSIFQQISLWIRLNAFRRSTPEPTFAERQQATFAAAKSNLRGLRLEYRMKTGQAGWAFHDRFLIFPRTQEGVLAWSLGSSINSLGRQHHILQRVDDAQLIADDFEELWNQLDEPEHLIWRTPQ
jgi:hypothetical protein